MTIEEILADLPTWLGLPIALGALIVGVATLMNSARTARLQQMQSVFKDYLRLQFDYNAHVGAGSSQARRLRANLSGFKMYSLEEMVLWLRRERKLTLLSFWSQFHRNHIASWQRVVEWQLDNCTKEDFAEFEISKDTYGPDMHREVQRSLIRKPLELRQAPPYESLDGPAPPGGP